MKSIFDKQHLEKEAKKIIQNNWKENYSVPSLNLYPFQWNWDSCFVSMGLAHFDVKKSIKEINSLFSGQWENGMLPHIIFHNSKKTTYFPDHSVWDTFINEGACRNPKTSGIIQPPVYGVVLEKLYDLYPKNERVAEFIKEIFPKMLKANNFLYNYRDPENEGLIYIFHPWESGRDNSPIWDKSLNRIKINPNDIRQYTRKDTSIADPSERPTQEQYDRYVYLLELGRKHKYDKREIFEESPFLIQDVLMNALLIATNKSLIKIGTIFNFDVEQLKEWQKTSIKSFKDKFWNRDLEFYCSYDLRSNSHVQHREIGGLIPIFAEIPTEKQVKNLVEYLENIHKNNFYLCPSFDINDSLFDAKRYWRGPIWPHMNLMIQKGLKSYGYHKLANKIVSDTLEIVSKQGFFEYYEPNKKSFQKIEKGYGGENFSWTASTIISLLNEIN